MKKFAFNKKSIIQVIFILALLLLIVNVVADKLSAQKPKTKLSEITAENVNVVFLNSLYAFALHRSWIKEINKRHAGKVYNYDVEIPKDLPIPVVLKEIYGNFYNDNVNLKSYELVIGGKTQLDIFSDKNLTLSALFNYNDSLKRQIDTTGLLLNGIEQLSDAEVEHLIKFPQTFAALLRPSKFSARLCDSLTEFRKEYAVLLNDKSTELEYKLRPGFSPLRIKSVIGTIISDYPKAIFYVIDDNSGLYSSAAYYLIKFELKRRNIKLYKLSSIARAEKNSGATLRENFIKLVEKNSGGSKKLILIDAGDFDKLQQDIFNLIKIGYKFVNPSVIVSMARSGTNTAK